jgi:glycosyltransferase involved in cell wall biosynthesis
MALGCPVVASTSPCLPEVCGDSALFADPDDLDGWVQAIMKLKEDGALRNAMVTKGRARAASYSWRSIAVRYLELMAEVDGQATASSEQARRLGAQ